MVRVALFMSNAILREALATYIPGVGRYELVVATGEVAVFKERVMTAGDVRIAVLGVLGDEDAGCGLLRWMREHVPGANNLVMGCTPTRPSTQRVMVGGAASVLCNCAALKDVATALEKLSVPGGTYHDHLVHQVYQDPPIARAEQDERPAVSGAQARVLRAVCRPGGASDKELAELLDLSVATVRSHLRKLYDAFGVSGRQALIDQARGLGYHLL